MKLKLLFLLVTLIPFLSFSQAHISSKEYVSPTDPLVLKNIEEWQDLKFGLFIHWGYI